MVDEARPPKLATTIAESPSTNVGRTESLPLSLIVIGRGWVRAVELPSRGDVTLGRDPVCDIVIDDPAVSRKHASLSIGDQLIISDLGSRRGVIINGARLATGARAEVSAGETFSLGPVSAMIQVSATASAKSARGISAMADMEHKLTRLARGAISVLICGETGAGKERVAEMVHHLSPRADGPFVRVNCGAISEALLESELFGHAKGAFTGADVAKPGLLEAAHGGSIFLDEVGEMPLSLQVKLLRTLESRQVRRVGSVESRDYDARFVAATNRDLRVEVAEKRFREDLYYRLAGAVVWVPPLRDRIDEVLSLARLFLAEQSKLLDEPTPSLSVSAVEWLTTHDWPGNVRELKNTMERAHLLADDGVIERAHLTEDGQAGPTAAPIEQSTQSAEGSATAGSSATRRRIVSALAETGGNQKLAAKLLGISRRTLINWLDKYNVPRPRKSHKAKT